MLPRTLFRRRVSRQPVHLDDQKPNRLFTQTSLKLGRWDTRYVSEAASHRRPWFAGCVIAATLSVFSGMLATPRHAEGAAPFQDVASRERTLEFEVISIHRAEQPSAFLGAHYGRCLVDGSR
jgi:hypothetical protein